MNQNQEIYEILKNIFKNSPYAINDYRRSINYYVAFAEKTNHTQHILNLTETDIIDYFNYLDTTNLSESTILYRKRSFRSVIKRISEFLDIPHLATLVKGQVKNDVYLVTSKHGCSSKPSMNIDDVTNFYEEVLRTNNLRNITIISLMLLAGFSAPEIVSLDNSMVEYNTDSKTFIISKEWLYADETDTTYFINTNHIILSPDLSLLLNRYLSKKLDNNHDRIFLSQTHTPLTYRGIDYIIDTTSKNRKNPDHYRFYRADMNYIGKHLSPITPAIPMMTTSVQGKLLRSDKNIILNEYTFADLKANRNPEHCLYFDDKDSFFELANNSFAISIFTNNQNIITKSNDTLDYRELKNRLSVLLKDYLLKSL